MNVVLANLTWLLHAAFVLWFCLTPFVGSEPMLVLHLFIGPFLFFHWIMNDDTCSLTLLEMKLRGLEKCETSFFYNLVSPIYKPRDAEVRSVAWVLAVSLWLVTVSRVLRRPNMIGDMFRQAFGKGGVESSTAAPALVT